MMDLAEVVEGLDDIQASIIRANHDPNLLALQGYHEKVAKAVKAFYDGVATSSLGLDNTLQFTSALIGHVHGAMEDLARTKLLTIFKGRARG